MLVMLRFSVRLFAMIKKNCFRKDIKKLNMAMVSLNKMSNFALKYSIHY